MTGERLIPFPYSGMVFHFNLQMDHGRFLYLFFWHSQQGFKVYDSKLFLQALDTNKLRTLLPG